MLADGGRSRRLGSEGGVCVCAAGAGVQQRALKGCSGVEWCVAWCSVEDWVRTMASYVKRRRRCMRPRVGKCGGPKPNFKAHTALGMAGGRALLSTIDKQDDARCYGEGPTLAPCADVPVAGARPCSPCANNTSPLESSSTPIPCLVTAALARQNFPLLVPNAVSRVSTGNTHRTREPPLLAPPTPLATVIRHRRTLTLRTWDPDCA